MGCFIRYIREGHVCLYQELWGNYLDMGHYKSVNMEGSFSFSENFTGDVSAWNVSSVTNMEYLFLNSSNFSSDVSNWNTSNVRNFTRAFYNASWFNETICWDLSSGSSETLSQVSCFTKGDFDCSCSGAVNPSLPADGASVDNSISTATSSQALTNPCKIIINAECDDESPPPILQVCDPTCSCCSMEEFVRTIKKFSEKSCETQDCCLSREDDIFLVDCESGIRPGYGVAYMSYDYSQSGGSREFQCGDSAYGDPLWFVLTEEEAQICESVVRSKILDVGACSTSGWPCT